jgi:predicted lipoprotein with Yx(FWY)xxD motif
MQIGALVAAALAVGVVGLSPAGTASAAGSKGVEIVAAVTPFGAALKVGSGAFAGYTLYFLTSDHGNTFGCTTTPVKTAIGKILCAGPSNDNAAEWPGLTTTGAPVAGAGVKKSLLGTVTRSFGTQVTYAGHPLYLFDPKSGQLAGEEYDEPDLPPWRGIWYLMSPTGVPLPWAGSLSTTVISGKKVVAAQMLTLNGWVDFPVYSFSDDTPKKSACQSGICALVWPAVLTSGTPAVSGGLDADDVSTLSTSAGIQVEYNHLPLYYFADEGVTVSKTGVFIPQGNGEGLTTGHGVWGLVIANVPATRDRGGEQAEVRRGAS